jgi:4-alpha-glucanotransferase
MEMKRAGGVLAHPSSFPSPYGIGDFGSGAFEFVDFLHEAKQTLWQVLPLGPTSYGDSPYQSFSTFAGNHYLLSPDELVKKNYLKPADLTKIPDFDPRVVDYGPLIEYKMRLLRKAYEGFKKVPASVKKFNAFCKKNADWLDNYALFVAIKWHYIAERKEQLDPPELAAYAAANAGYLTDSQISDYFYGAVWSSWPDGLARRDKAALAEMGAQLDDEVSFYMFLQYEFFEQWGKVKDYANKKGISIIGDIPIFVAMDSSDVWASPELFQLDKDGRPISVAGVPPDYFSATGQLWGNPLYNWDAHKKTGFAWWVKRVSAVLSVYDIVRIDHFRGFESYWAVPYGEETAINGKWVKGPGKALFTAIEKQLGSLPIIAEDLGVITKQVDKLRTGCKLPGMKVLHFAFDPDGSNPYMPHNFTSPDTVVYTGTHDNDTSRGWYSSAPEVEKDYFRRYMNVSGDDAAWDLIRLAYSSSANYAVVPVQDILDLGSADRMNMPGIPHGYWRFRYTRDMLSQRHAERLRYLTELFNRTSVSKKPDENEMYDPAVRKAK